MTGNVTRMIPTWEIRCYAAMSGYWFFLYSAEYAVTNAILCLWVVRVLLQLRRKEP